MTALLTWLLSEAGQLIIPLVLALAAGLGLYARGQSVGQSKAKQQAKEADHDRADQIRDAADRARRADDAGADPLGRLREAGRLRD